MWLAVPIARLGIKTRAHGLLGEGTASLVLALCQLSMSSRLCLPECPQVGSTGVLPASDLV